MFISVHLFCQFSGPPVSVGTASIPDLTLCRACTSLPMSHDLPFRPLTGGPARSERDRERRGAPGWPRSGPERLGRGSWMPVGAWATAWFQGGFLPLFSFLFISFCKSFPKRILNINKWDKNRNNNTKINSILSMNAKACCYPYDEFYSPQNNLFAKFNAHKNT